MGSYILTAYFKVIANYVKLCRYVLINLSYISETLFASSINSEAAHSSVVKFAHIFFCLQYLD